MSSVRLHTPHSLHISPAHTDDTSCEVSFIMRWATNFLSTLELFICVSKTTHDTTYTLYLLCSSVAARHRKLAKLHPTLLLKQPACYKPTTVTMPYTTYHSSVCLSSLQMQHSAAGCYLFFPSNIPNIINFVWCWLSQPLSLLLCRHQATGNDDTNPQEVFQILLAAIDHDPVLI